MSGGAKNNRPEQQDGEYEETLKTLRHYSGLRFTILNVFLALTAALMYVLYGRRGGAPLPPEITYPVKFFGLILAIGFWLVELRLDGYLVKYAEFLKKIRPDSHWFARYEVSANENLLSRYESQSGKTVHAINGIHVAAILYWLLSFVAKT